MFLFLNFLKKKKVVTAGKPKVQYPKNHSEIEKIAVRKGEIGEYKIDIQLSQFPKEYRYLSDLLIKNPKAMTGYSQIDHLIVTPYGIFVIETKNYQGTIYGGKERKTWSVNGKFKMMNPLNQNYGHIQALKALIDKKYASNFVSIVSFTKRCTVKIEPGLRKISSDELVIYDIELTEYITRKINVEKLQRQDFILSNDEILTIYDSFLKANIMDTDIRERHKKGLQNNIKKDTQESSCSICNQPVSQKVKSYCLSNKKFNGRIYCFDHQKF